MLQINFSKQKECALKPPRKSTLHTLPLFISLSSAQIHIYVESACRKALRAGYVRAPSTKTQEVESERK